MESYRDVAARFATPSLLMLLVLLGFGVVALTTPSSVHAQDGEEVVEEEPVEEEPTPEEPEPAAATDDGPKQVNFLVYVVTASPTFFIIMLVLSIYLVSTVVTNYGKLQTPKIIPPDAVAQLDAMLNEKNYKGAYEYLRNDQSLFCRSLTVGVERIQDSYDRAVDASLGVAEDGKLEMEHKVSPVATIGTVAPMIGLMGTVIGMILAFQQIALGGQPRPAELADKIGLALVTTLEGIIVAVPAIAAFAFLRNKISRLVYEVESLSEAYLWRFKDALKK